MKLLILQDYLRMGGTENQAVAIANEATCRGNDTLLLTMRPGGVIKSRVKSRHQSLQSFDTGIDEWAPGLARVVREFLPQTILCMGQVANAFIPRLRKITPTAKIVATVRTGKRIPPKLLKAYGAASVVLSNSYALRNALETRGVGTTSKMEVVGNGLLINPEIDPVARMLLRRKMGAKEDTTVILCLQRFLPQKGQHLLMEHFLCAAERPEARNAQLWLVGRGWFELPLRAYTHVLDDRIKVITPNLPTSHYYNAADIAATVSHEDSLPNFLIEAHAFGLPGICEDYAGCGEVIINGITGSVVPVGDDLAYAAALQQMILCPPLRNFFGQNAKNLTFRFSFQRQMDQIFKLLEV